MKIHELFQDEAPCPWPNRDGAKSLFTDPGTDEWKTLARAPVGSEAWFRAWFSQPFLTNGRAENEISPTNEKVVDGHGVTGLSFSCDQRMPPAKTSMPNGKKTAFRHDKRVT